MPPCSSTSSPSRWGVRISTCEFGEETNIQSKAALYQFWFGLCPHVWDPASTLTTSHLQAPTSRLRGEGASQDNTKVRSKIRTRTQACCLPIGVCTPPEFLCAVGTDVAAAFHPRWGTVLGVCVTAVLPEWGHRWGCVLETLLGARREESKGQEGSKRKLRMLSRGRLPKFFRTACLAKAVSSRVNTVDS